MTGHNLAPVKFQCSKLQTSNKTCWRSQHGDFFHCKFVPGCLLQKRLATLDGRFSSKWRQQLFTIHDSVSHYNKWEWVALRLMNAVCRTWLSSSCTNTKLSWSVMFCTAWIHREPHSCTKSRLIPMHNPVKFFEHDLRVWVYMGLSSGYGLPMLKSCPLGFGIYSCCSPWYCGRRLANKQHNLTARSGVILASLGQVSIIEPYRTAQISGMFTPLYTWKRLHMTQNPSGCLENRGSCVLQSFFPLLQAPHPSARTEGLRAGFLQAEGEPEFQKQFFTFWSWIRLWNFHLPKIHKHTRFVPGCFGGSIPSLRNKLTIHRQRCPYQCHAEVVFY